jgi:hypothetical protein
MESEKMVGALEILGACWLLALVAFVVVVVVVAIQSFTIVVSGAFDVPMRDIVFLDRKIHAFLRIRESSKPTLAYHLKS